MYIYMYPYIHSHLYLLWHEKSIIFGVPLAVSGQHWKAEANVYVCVYSYWRENLQFFGTFMWGCACVRVCMCDGVHVYVWGCVCEGVHVWWCEGVCTCVCVCVSKCLAIMDLFRPQKGHSCTTVDISEWLIIMLSYLSTSR